MVSRVSCQVAVLPDTTAGFLRLTPTTHEAVGRWICVQRACVHSTNLL